MSDFETSFLNHDAWLGQAEQFAYAAEALIVSIEPLRKTRTEEANSKMVGYIRGALLLLAVSVENSLKAVKIAQGQVKVENGKVNRRPWAEVILVTTCRYSPQKQTSVSPNKRLTC